MSPIVIIAAAAAAAWWFARRRSSAQHAAFPGVPDPGAQPARGSQPYDPALLPVVVPPQAPGLRIRRSAALRRRVPLWMVGTPPMVVQAVLNVSASGDVAAMMKLAADLSNQGYTAAAEEITRRAGLVPR